MTAHLAGQLGVRARWLSHSPRRYQSHLRRATLLGLVVSLVAGVAVYVVMPVQPVSADPSSGFLDDVPSTTPSSLGDIDLTELEYGDPTEALDIIDPPTADAADGGASLSHPLTVPPGRAGVEPELALQYSSGGGSSWVGTGWDLSVGAVTLDTEFGAPRYLTALESETYVLDGDRLFPNAIRTELSARLAGPRADWVRQTEDDHDLIIRHGSAPDQYCWEVRDTKGNRRFYGGEPDGNDGCTRIESAILTAEPTGVVGGARGDYHWALTYMVDISGNTMRFSYDELTGVQIGRTGSAAIGVSLYLREIVYTGFDDAAMNQPAYRVSFLRDGNITGDPSPNPASVARRTDIMVDASAGAPVVTRELLREVKVEYLPAGYYAAPRTEPARLVKGWILEYDVSAPFDKSLLTRVGQYGATTQGVGQAVHAWHDFDWFDEVTDGNGTYSGFAPPEEWGTGNEANRVNIAAESALGTSYRGGADGGAYIGFNPAAASKTLSFGGSFNIAGGLSGEVSTLLDLNGDGLPDKVYLDGNSVVWRPNLRTAVGASKQGNTWFGPAQPVRLVNGSNALPGGSLNSLGTSFDLKVNAQFEAYPVVAIQVGGGFAFSFGDVYFEDANGDGRVDVIRPGGTGQHTVYFNVLIDGVPTFIDSTLASVLSERLEVPLDAFSPSSPNGAVAEISQLLVNTSPRIDTVRRWIAPHRGLVSVTGPVSLVAASAYTGDGAQVSIESGGTQRWVDTLTRAVSSTSPTVEIDVAAGQAIYFRNHVIANASGDQVNWNPTITYTHIGDPPAGAPPTAAPDANGRNQLAYTASQDFTLFGRTGARTPLDQPGPLQVDVAITTAAGGLSDDLRVVVRHGRGNDDDNDLSNNLKSSTTVLTVPQLTAGTVTGSTSITVEAPERAPAVPPATEGVITGTDWVMIDVVSDSPVDPAKFSVDVTTSAAGAQQPDVSQIPADQRPDIPLDVPIVPNVRVFARTDHVAPYVPVTAPNMENPTTSTLEVAVTGDAGPWFGTSTVSNATVTIKTLAGGVVAKGPLTITNSFLTWSGSATVDFVPVSGAQYYVDVSVPDPTIGRAVDLAATKLTFRWTQTEQDADGNDAQVAQSQEVSDVGQLHWPDVDGVFPSGNRGWALAGYNADYDSDGAAASEGGALREGRFTVRPRNTDGTFDEDTPVPTASESPDPEDITASLAAGDEFDPSYPYIPWGESGSPVATMWRAGGKPTLNGTGTTLQSDRLGADVAITGAPTAGRSAPRMLSVSGDFHFLLGLIASFTAAAGGGRSLSDFQDFNGDGFPDWRDGSNVDYTGPRGAKAGSNSVSANPFDLTLALGGGINGSAISASNTTHTPNTDGGAMGSGVEPTSTKSSRGMNLGLGFSVQSSWTNPTSSGNGFGGEIASNDPDAKNVLGPATSKSDPRGTQVDRAFIDINGDGLPDRVDTYTSGELWVALNLGYRFADGVLWAEGRTSASQDLAGSFSLGFQLQSYEFAGGVVYNEGVGFSQFDWIDIDGDGVPDSVDGTGSGDPTTIFGAGDGMSRADVDYGDFPVGEVLLDAVFDDDDAIDLPGGQTSVSRSTGLAGGVDFSIYIGPICVVACYIVINPGVHGGYDRQTQQIQMVDMNGDGYNDAVKSTDYEDVEVRLNKRGRTNLLETVTNPLGAQIRLGYDRIGNTVQNPQSMWVMSSVAVHDGRQGDGDDLQRSRFTYGGATWDPLLREQLGFSSIVEQQLDGTGNVARSYERDYLNGNPSETGTLVEERVYDDRAAGGRRLVQRSRFTWEFANANPRGSVAPGPAVAYGAEVLNLPGVRTPARVVLFDTALSPRLVTDEVVQFDQYDDDEQVLRTIYTYNPIGDVLTVWETNEDEVEGDDTYTVLTYSDCAVRNGDRASTITGSWVSVPQTVSVFAGEQSTQLMKFRDGGPDLCDNSVPVRIAELVAQDAACGGANLYAITEMSFDDWGNYDAVAWPSNEVPACSDFPPASVASADLTFEGCSTLSPEDDATRYCVDYECDPHRFTDVALVTDNHGVSATATYEPRNGRLLSRDDPAGNTTSYSYDAVGRLATVTAPREQGGPNVTMRYAYGGLSSTFDPLGAHAWSTVGIHDVFNPGNDIETATFVDGAGRVVQRKRDADVDQVAGEARIIEGAVDFDALGRAVKEWYPVVEPRDAAHPLTTYNRLNSESGAAANVPVTTPFVRTYDVFDRMVRQVLPDLSVERIRYEFAVLPQYDGGIVMSKVTTTDPLQRAIARWSDVGGAVFRNEDTAAPANLSSPSIDTLAALPTAGTLVGPRIAASVSTASTVTTRYDYDRLGRLVTVIDAAEAATSHTYDFLDNVTSTDTPDGGLTSRTFAPSGQLLTVSRANGTLATYAYDRDRLVRLSYSDDTPTVRYEWGDDGAPDNGAGRVLQVVDGVMERTYGYDGAGNVDRETATERAAPFGIVKSDLDTWTTEWVYDSLARIEFLTYPDGERLEHDYDRGGRPTRLASQAPQHDLYDQFGNAVARPDAEIAYIDAVRYDQFGEATYVRTGTGVETRYAFEPTRRFVASIDTDATATTQFDGTVSTARPLQRLRYRYDAVGNVSDATNRLYESAGDTKVTDLGPAPVNNVPGPSQAGYTYDGFYRLTAAAGTYVDQQEIRNYSYVTDLDDNGTLVSKRQVTTTVGTTGSTPKRGDSGNGKKGNGATATAGTTTTQATCESNTGSGGGSFNQDPETTYVIAKGDLEYAVDDTGASTHRLVRSGFRRHTYDANGNQTGWVENCAMSTGGSSTISRTFEWDAENRLTRIAEGNNDTDVRYTAEGARGMERGPGGRTWFVNEHWRTVNDGHRYANVFLGSQLVASHRTSPQPPAPAPCTDTPEAPCGCDGATACVVADVSLCDLATRVFDAATNTCQPKETRTIHFLHKDLQGSLRVATDEVGRVFQYVDYLPNGRPWVAGQSTIKDTPYLFAGGWTDTTYDLVNFGDRWYEPREEGFLSVEPLLTDDPYAAVNDPWVLSAYNYAASNPLRYVDSDGRATRRANNGYELGGDLLERHEAGNITISVASREKRPAPAITFGGRYSNDQNGQDLQKSFQDHKDKADRISTAITIKTEDGVRKVYVFGNKISDDTGDQPKTGSSPTSSGASDSGPPSAPKQASSSSPPTANDSSSSPPSGQSGGTGSPSGRTGAATPPPQADSGSSSGGNDSPSSQPQPPKPTQPSG